MFTRLYHSYLPLSLSLKPKQQPFAETQQDVVTARYYRPVQIGIVTSLNVQYYSTGPVCTLVSMRHAGYPVADERNWKRAHVSVIWRIRANKSTYLDDIDSHLTEPARSQIMDLYPNNPRHAFCSTSSIEEDFAGVLYVQPCLAGWHVQVRFAPAPLVEEASIQTNRYTVFSTHPYSSSLILVVEGGGKEWRLKLSSVAIYTRSRAAARH
jgi:hypothetical protein